MDTVLTLQNAARAFEEKLGISERWTEDCETWKEADSEGAMQVYQKAIDRLEYLVVSKFFELDKMNRAGVGSSFFIKEDFSYLQ